MGKAEKLKPTQPGANDCFVGPALLSRRGELTRLFHRERLKSTCFATQAGASQRSMLTRRTGQRGARVPAHG